MPKNFVVESVRHHLLCALARMRRAVPTQHQTSWAQVAKTLCVEQCRGGILRAQWTLPRAGSIEFSKKSFVLYRRGDLPSAASPQDPIGKNMEMGNQLALKIGEVLGLGLPVPDQPRAQAETEFHDRWASGVQPHEVMVRESFEVPTAPENRHILSLLGDLKGKRVLDLGCGLGEASVYLAGRGALVTACDISPGMLEMTSRVARHHNVSVSTHLSPAENTGLPESSFDVVYAANVLHHVDVSKTVSEIHRILVPGGWFFSWDPLGHNPIIDVYRRMARDVRTPDEHPLKMKDLQIFKKYFRNLSWRCFWLTTQVTFVYFYLWDRVHPSAERYWKKILEDAQRISAFYIPLEKLDDFILKWCPWLGRYCWNIVIWGRK